MDMKRQIMLSLFCLACTVIHAKVVLPAYFTDNMILQQNTQVTFHGKAAAGKTLKITTGWSDEIYQTRVEKDGAWSLSVPTPAAGGPYTLTFNDGKKLQLQNVLVGEVWFCSGQSNMEMPVAGWGKVMNYEQEIAAADYPSIRLFQVKKNISVAPLDDVESTMGGWQECSFATVPEFSSVAYFYARALWKELNVPIGVIDCTWGGTPAEAWTSYETLKKVLGFSEEAAMLKQADFDRARMEQAYGEKRAQWESLVAKTDKGMSGDKPSWAAPAFAEEGWQTMDLPGYWEGKGLKDFDGIVWFRHTLDIPAEWAGKPLTLRLGMIDDEDITYFNGVEVARGSGYMTPRTYVIPAELVKAGEAVLTIRVFDFGGEGGIHGQPEELYAESGGKRISLAGNWKYGIGLSLKGFTPAPVSPTQSSSYPTVLFNAMVNPWISFPIKGVIWYQGEANVGRAAQYGDLFPAMIADWRQQWKNDFPFYFVQLANFLESKEVQPDSEWAALREAQSKALNLESTAMATIIDIGLANDIHPKNKQEVGRRLALIALAQSYGKNVSFSGPVFQDYSIKGSRVDVCFKYANEGFLIKEGKLKGFTIAGPDHVFHPATAVVQGEKIVVSSPQVTVPLAIRYGWADNPDCNLYGINGLPAVLFRTDNW